VSAQPPAQAMIADRRFQHYEGPRLGLLYAFYALIWHSIGWVLGWKRSARYKIVPALMLVAAYLPSVIVVVVAAVVPANTPGLPTYLDLYGFVLTAVYVFVALTGPELVCPDRRYGTLRMYVTSNLNTTTYVAGKLVALWVVLAIVTVGPVLFQAAGYTFVGRGPATAAEAVKVLGQVVGGGLVFAVFFGTLALAAASLTDRNAFASAGIILGFVLSSATIGILQGALKAPDWVTLLAINQVPLELVSRIHHSPTPHGSLADWQVAAATVGWVAFGMLVLVLRYRGEGRR
jgi:ABC-2 type transport system permease protein